MTTRLTHDTQDVKATQRADRCRHYWLERYWYAVAAVLLLVVGAMPLTKGLVAVG